MKRINSALSAFLLSAALPLCASAQAFGDLLRASGEGAEIPALALPAQEAAAGEDFIEARQYLPPDNNEPGFDWETSRTRDQFFHTGAESTFLKSGPGQSADLAEGSGRCALSPNTLPVSQ